MALCLLSIVLLPGCWDQDEITSLAKINGLGIDAGSRPGMVRMTMQISPPGSSSAIGGTANASKLRAVTVEAESIIEGFGLLQSHLSREPFLLHLGYVVFGEQLARSGIGDVLAGLQGWAQIRGSVPVFVTTGSAEDALHAHSGIGRAPGEDISDLLGNIANSPVARRVSLNDVYNTLTGIGNELAIPIIELAPLRLESGDASPSDATGQSGQQFEEVVISRLALFQRDRWISELDALETMTLVLLLGESHQGVGTIQNPVDPSGIIVPLYESISIGYEVQGDHPEQLRLLIKPRLAIRLLEIRGQYDLQKEGSEPIVSAAKSDFGLQVSTLMQKLQEQNIDALGMGQQVSRHNPKLWRLIENQWDQVFPTVEILVEVDANLRSNGLLKKFFKQRR